MGQVLDRMGSAESWFLHGSAEPIALPNSTDSPVVNHSIPGAVEQTVLSACFLYTASADVATRFPLILISDPSGLPVAAVALPYSITATNVSVVTFGVGVQQFGANNAIYMGAGIPELRLGDGMTVTLGVIGGQIADTITSPRLFVRQWRVRE